MWIFLGQKYNFLFTWSNSYLFHKKIPFNIIIYSIYINFALIYGILLNPTCYCYFLLTKDILAKGWDDIHHNGFALSEKLFGY